MPLAVTLMTARIAHAVSGRSTSGETYTATSVLKDSERGDTSAGTERMHAVPVTGSHVNVCVSSNRSVAIAPPLPSSRSMTLGSDIVLVNTTTRVDGDPASSPIPPEFHAGTDASGHSPVS